MQIFSPKYGRHLSTLLALLFFVLAMFVPWIYILNVLFYSKDVTAFPVIFSREAGWTLAWAPPFEKDDKRNNQRYFIRPKAQFIVGYEVALVECGTVLGATARDNPIVAEPVVVGEHEFLLLRPYPDKPNFYLLPKYGCAVAPPFRSALADVVLNGR